MIERCEAQAQIQLIRISREGGGGVSLFTIYIRRMYKFTDTWNNFANVSEIKVKNLVVVSLHILSSRF